MSIFVIIGGGWFNYLSLRIKWNKNVLKFCQKRMLMLWSTYSYRGWPHFTYFECLGSHCLHFVGINLFFNGAPQKIVQQLVQCSIFKPLSSLMLSQYTYFKWNFSYYYAYNLPFSFFIFSIFWLEFIGQLYWQNRLRFGLI